MHALKFKGFTYGSKFAIFLYVFYIDCVPQIGFVTLIKWFWMFRKQSQQRHWLAAVDDAALQEFNLWMQ